MSTTRTEPVFDDAVAPSVFELDGGMMLWAGLSFGTASLVQYLCLTGRIQLPNPAMVGTVWMAALAVFIVGGIVLKIGSKRSHLDHPSVKRFRSIWLSLILGAMVVIAALSVILVRAHLGATAAYVTAPIMISVYGVGWRIASVMSGKTIFNVLALCAFAAAIWLAVLAGTATQSLGYSLALLGLAVIPGALLMQRQI